jgi:hypothetical protein
VARPRSVSGYAVPGIVAFLSGIVLFIVVVIALAFVVHFAGAGLFSLRFGHFILKLGFT